MYLLICSLAQSGAFLIEDVPGGKYKISVSYIGYSTSLLRNVAVNSKTKDVDLGKIMLSQGTEMTNEIVVVDEAPVMQMDAEKKTYNLDKSLVTESGSVTDVLKNIPSVTVDQDGNVSLRGSSDVKILINGRPSTMFGGDNNSNLESIPADNVEKIEIITNPSAKYDAEGTSGIINIVLKENSSLGYNVNLSSNVGTQDKYNTSVGINLRNNKFNFFVNYNFRLTNMNSTGVGYRQNLFSDSLRNFNQSSSGNNKNFGNFISGGLDYNIDKLNLVGFSLGYNNRNRDQNNLTTYSNTNINGAFTSLFNTWNPTTENGYTLDATLTYKKKFENSKKEFNASLSYSKDKEDETSNLKTQYYDANRNPLNNTPVLENSLTNNNYNFWTFQADFTNPISDDSKFEAGYRFSLRNTVTGVNYLNYDYTSSQWLPEVLKNNDANYDDYINAVYGTYMNKFKNFSYMLGLRFEYTDVRFDIQQNTTQYKTDYLSIFPSLHFSQKVSTNDDIMLNYTRRINRPRLHFLDPFVDYSDPLNLSAGNPYLKPEYINSVELGYAHYFPFAILTSSVFYRNVQDVINRYKTVDSTGVTFTTFNNVGNSNYYGFEFILQASPTKWWNGNINFSYFNMVLSGNNGSQSFENSTNSWTAKAISSMAIPNLFDIQLSYNYTGKTVTAQGEMEPRQSFDIALKKDFFNRRLSLTFRIQDLFKTQKFENITTAPGFTADMTRSRDSRVAFLTLTYRFGTDSNNKDKKKKQDDNNNNNGVEEDY